MSGVLAAIRRHAGDRPQALALTSKSERITYAELDRAIDGVAHILTRHLRDGRGAVGVALDNSIAWVLIDLALIKMSRASVPLPTFFTREQTNAALRDAGADWIISDVEDGEPLDIAGRRVWVQRGNGDDLRLQPNTAKVTYTSGSTASPKGVCLAQWQMEQVAESIVERFGRRFAGVHAPILPLGVLLENVAGLYAVLIAGGRYHVEGADALGCANPFKPDFARMGATLRDAQATSLILVPELMRGIMAARAFGLMDLPHLNLVAVGGAKVAPDLIAMARSIGMPVYEGYGLTECASVVAVNAPDAERAGTVGKPLSHVDVTITDSGEILVGRRTFLGYAGGPINTLATRTGDIGALDEDGFLTVTGRRDNLIITSFGRNVSPEWVESELLAEPIIRHAIVFGEGKPELRALIAPVVANVERDAIATSIERANARLPVYARIGAFELVAPLSAERGELTGNGRIRRQAILAANASFVNG